MINFRKKFTYLIPLVLLSLALTACLPKKSTSTTSTSDSATQTIPDNWTTYKNTLHNFSFKHPSDWNIEVITDTANFTSVIIKKDDTTQEDLEMYTEMITPQYSINVTVNQNKKSLSSKDFYLDNFSESSRAKATQDIEEITIAGLPAIKYPEGAAPSSGPSTGILITKGNKAFRLIYSALAYKETHLKFMPEFETLLSSFIFTN